MSKILVIGKGGREEAIKDKLLNENNKVYNLKYLKDFSIYYDFVIKHNIDFILVGSELPLNDGIVDYFKNKNIKIIGASKKSARLESSKVFAKQFMKRHNIPTAKFKIYNNQNDALEYIKKNKGKLVVKYDGLAFGKGSFVCKKEEEVFKALEVIEKKFAKNKNFNFILEEILEGQEISIMTILDNKNILSFQVAKDYKLSLNNNKGKNTGGMGAYTPVDFIKEKDLEFVKKNIINKTMDALIKENLSYKGFLYFGLILTSNGPKLLEYNVRLGDPETQVLLPAMKNSFSELLNNCLNNSLGDSNVLFSNSYYLTLVLASKGYPDSYEINKKITISKKFNYNKNKLYFCAVKNKNNELFTDGGRVINIVSYGSTIAEAQKNVYKEAGLIDFDGKYHRDDIGKQEDV